MFSGDCQLVLPLSSVLLLSREDILGCTLDVLASELTLMSTGCV